MPDIEVITIGVLSKGIDGSDRYLLVTSNEDELTEQQVYDHVMPQYYDDGHGPGTSFCHNISIMQKPWTNEFVVIVHRQYDV